MRGIFGRLVRRAEAPHAAPTRAEDPILKSVVQAVESAKIFARCERLDDHGGRPLILVTVLSPQTISLRAVHGLERAVTTGVLGGERIRLFWRASHASPAQPKTPRAPKQEDHDMQVLDSDLSVEEFERLRLSTFTASSNERKSP